jgi:hypothetical protein
MWETVVPQGLLPAYYNVQAVLDEEFGKYLANQGLALNKSCTLCFGKGEVYPRHTPANEACITHSHLLCRVPCLLNKTRTVIFTSRPIMAGNFSCSTPGEAIIDKQLCHECRSPAQNWYRELRTSTKYQVSSADDFWEQARVRKGSSGFPIGKAYWRDMLSINESRNGSVEWLFVSSDAREMGCMHDLFLFGKELIKYDPVTREACALIWRSFTLPRTEFQCMDVHNSLPCRELQYVFAPASAQNRSICTQEYSYPVYCTDNGTPYLTNSAHHRRILRIT